MSEQDQPESENDTNVAVVKMTTMASTPLTTDSPPVATWPLLMEPCRFGYEEHDGSRYCFAHGGFWEAGTTRGCDRRPPCARTSGTNRQEATNDPLA